MTSHHAPFRNARQAGFTLIEILVATLAFAVLLSAVYVVFANGKRLRDSATARVQALRLQDRAAGILERDLRNALVSGGRLAATLLGQTRGPESRFPGYLKLTTASAQLADDEMGGDLQEVEYFVTDQFDTTNRNSGVLVRSVERNLLAQVREPTPLEPLLANVAALELAFFDGQQWIETWEFTQAGDTLPEAIRVRIQPATDLRATQYPPPIEILVPWPTQPASTNSTNTADSGDASGGNSDADGPEGPPNNDFPPSDGGRRP